MESVMNVQPSVMDYEGASAPSLLRCKPTNNKVILKSIKKTLAEELAHEPTLTKMADKYCISSRTLNRRLNKMGVSFRSILTEVRMDQAVYFLGNTEMKIYEVAIMLGYRDPSNFTKAFKTWMNCSPREFRYNRCA
jgi:AraC-like DNA-binding protein